MSKKIAPTLQRLFGGKRNPFRAPEEGAALRAELRALLSVFRIAEREVGAAHRAARVCGPNRAVKSGPENCYLCAALDRAKRVSDEELIERSVCAGFPTVAVTLATLRAENAELRRLRFDAEESFQAAVKREVAAEAARDEALAALRELVDAHAPSPGGGFDTAHAGDYIPAIAAIIGFKSVMSGKYRGWAHVMAEVDSMVSQALLAKGAK